MTIPSIRTFARVCSRALCFTPLCALLCACGGDSSGLYNRDPGDNDPNTVCCFGDSITANVSGGPSYPERFAALVGMNVCNEGISGSTASYGASRVSSVIQRRKPAYMLVLYGVNDILFYRSVSDVRSSLASIVSTCQDRHVLPVLATYPVPIASHAIFAGSVRRLNEAIRELAGERGLECVDLEKEFSHNGEPDPSLYLPDGLHPTPDGNQIIAAAFADLF